jgi:drug/metabolite transporter (DMT)-like permease
MRPFLKSIKEMQGYVLITVASILWGTLGILAKLSFEYGILPETLIALRLAISFATVSVVLALFSKGSFKVRKTDVLLFLIFGVFATALQRISYFYAVDLTTATVAAILFYTYPVFVTISAYFYLKEKITSRELLAIILTFSGVALVVRIYNASSLKVNLVGIIFGLLSSLLFTLYFMITKKLRNRYASWTLALYGDGIGLLTLTPVIFLSIPQIMIFPPQLWLLIFTIAWIPSLLAYLLYSYALKHVKASKGSILSVMEPLSAALFSTIFIGERLENPQIVGIALALIGVVLLFRMKEKRIPGGSE